MALVTFVTDLIFATKISSTAKAVGVPYQAVRSVEGLRKRLDDPTAAKVGGLFVDLNATGADPMEIIRFAKTKGLWVVAYLSHVQVELAEQAKAAGADDVLPRSAFSANLPDLIKKAAELSVPRP